MTHELSFAWTGKVIKEHLANGPVLYGGSFFAFVVY